MVPADLVLHVGDPFALDRMGDDAERLGAPLGSRQRVDQRRGVVAVGVDDFPAKGAELVAERLDVVGLGDARALLQSIAIDDQCEVGELVSCSAAIAASQLLPPGNSPSPVMTKTAEVRLVELPRNGDADGDRHPVAKRAGVRFDAGDIVAVWVAVQQRFR